MKFTMFSAFLFFLGWMSVVTGIDKPGTACCLKVENTRVQADNIVKYDIQEAVICPFRAVRFHTKKNKVICSDPESGHAKNIMKKVDERMTTTPSKEPIKCHTSTTNIIPAVTMKNKTPGTQTEARTSTTAPTIVTTVETNRPTIVTTVETNRPTIVTTVETIRPTIVTTVETNRPTIVTTVKTETTAPTIVTKVETRPETAITKTTNQPTSVSKELDAKNCCMTVTENKPAFHEIVDYKVQETLLCSVRAVIFITVENNTVCSSPVEDWVQDYIQNLNRGKSTEKTDKREFENNNFCLKKEQTKYFCIKQP